MKTTNGTLSYRKGTLLQLTALLFCCFTVISCRKNNQGIPYVPVDISININNPAYIDLNVVGGWEYVTGGSKGILIYRASQDEFRTYDRHATANIDANCAVEVESNNITAADPCTTTKYLITDGSVTEGEGALPLHGYQNTFDGTNLRIFN